MRIILLGLLATLSLYVNAQTTPSADQILKDAYMQAGKNNKNVFVIFHASWCGWCHKMDTAMNDVSCKKAFDDNYEIRHITVLESDKHKADENPGGAELLKKYKGDSGGIPFWLVFNAKGELLADSRMTNAQGTLANVGCPAETEEIAYFISVLQKTSKMKPAQLDAVKTSFSKIKASVRH